MRRRVITGLVAVVGLGLALWILWRPAGPLPGIVEANGRIEGDQAAIQYLSLLSPLRHYMEIGLGIFLKGVGIGVLWRPAALMTAVGFGGAWRR